MKNKRIQRLVCIILIQMAVLDVVIGAILINKLIERNNSTHKNIVSSKAVSSKKIPHIITILSFESKRCFVLKNPNANNFSAFLQNHLFYSMTNSDIKLDDSLKDIRHFTATAYDLSYESCGKYPGHPEYGVTYSGKKAQKGRTVAVDPNVIPLGSLIYIDFPKPYTGMDGWYVAEDTGSKVKGNIVDVFFGESALKEARKFGRREVSIEVISPG
ncbi:MAG: 3D domain-containing protein [Bacillota bacterium]|nr:3D domain-containing protein [Bacillota bacterium]